MTSSRQSPGSDDNVEELQQQLREDRETVLTRVQAQGRWRTGVALAVSIVATGWLVFTSVSVSRAEARKSELEGDVEKLQVRQQELENLNAKLEREKGRRVRQNEALRTETRALREEEEELEARITSLRGVINDPSINEAEKVAQLKAKLATNTDKARDLWRRGHAEYSKGKSETAKKLFEEALKLDPGYAPALTTLGRIASDSGNTGEARRLWSAAISALPSYSPALHNLSVLEHKAGNTSLACKLNQRAIRARPSSGKYKSLRRRWNCDS